MSQIWKIVKWEFMNRVKTKLFLITTFLLPFFMGALMYLPTILMDLEPEDETSIGLVHDDEIDLLMERFKQQCDISLLLQNGEPQFSFTRMFDEKEALNLIKDLNQEVFIIGGSKIYELFEPWTTSLVITRVLKDFEGDAFFPDINWNNWQIKSKEEFLDEKSGISCKLEEYLRKA